MANVLRNAIAYRSGVVVQDAWANARRDPIPVACPECAVEYDLFVTENASGEDALKWVEALLEQMESQHPRHDDVVVF